MFIRPMSFSQQRLWFLHQFIEPKRVYNIYRVLSIEGNITTDGFRQSLLKIIERHEILRTTYTTKDSLPVQIINPEPRLNDVFNFITRNTVVNEHKSISELFNELLNHEFDLEKGPLIRFSLIENDNGGYYIFILLHHIICDGWSIEILVRELTLMYQKYITGEKLELSELPIQFVDYSEWQKEFLSGETKQKLAAYWRHQLKDAPQVFTLPADHDRPAFQKYEGAIEYYELKGEFYRQLKGLCVSMNVSPFMFLISSFSTLFSVFSGESEVIIGTPIANRNNKGLENLIGFFANTLVLRIKLAQCKDFKSLLEHVKEVTLASYKHQDFPFELVVEQLLPERNSSYSPLFQILVAYYTVKNQAFEIPGTKVKAFDLHNGTSKFDLSLLIEDSESKLKIGWEYNTSLYKKETVLKWIAAFETLIGSILKNPAENLKLLNCINEDEKEKILGHFNNNALKIPSHNTLLGFFEEQVKRSPDSCAIEFNEECLTYLQLNEESNRLARYLRDLREVRPEDLVGIRLKRSTSLIITMLAVLKSGAAYVPIDTDYPEERINYIITDSNCKLVIDGSELANYKKIAGDYPSENLETFNNPAHSAYVIYTSGSTGKPKGVVIEHRSVIAFIEWCKLEFGRSDFESVFAVTSVCFDLSIFEIFYTLSAGKKIKLLKSPLMLAGAIKGARKVLLNTVPSVIGALIKEEVDLSLISVLNMAGEPIPQHFIEHIDLNLTEVRNLYGPSEDTTYSTVYRITDNSRIHIGKPISNTRIYILNNELSCVPIGVSGEIYIGGSGLARGYLNKPELTAQKFIQDPFRPGEIIYRTGDIGKWLPDGNIIFEGRNDNQVKIRGFRIELGEIEAAILKNNIIESASVIVCTNSQNEKSIVAFLVCRHEFNEAAILSKLKESLPAFMIPSQYITLSELPLNANGKVDKIALVALFDSVAAEPATEFTPPRNETEKLLAQIWENILEQSPVGAKDDFFARGGHSLKITRLSNKIYQRFGIQIPLNRLFVMRTLEEQSSYISEIKKMSFSKIEEIRTAASYPLSYSQKRLWLLCQMDMGSIAYNIPVALSLEGALDLARLNRSLKKLVERHEILRTVFKENENGDVNQYVKTSNEINITARYLDCRGQKDQISELVRQELEMPFDLVNGPLMRLFFLQTEEQRFILTFNIHHIISDAWSINILVNELFEFYDCSGGIGKAEPVPLNIQHKDYVFWQENNLKAKRAIESRNFWITAFKGNIPILELPVDNARPKIKTFNGGVVKTAIDPELGHLFNNLCLQNHATVFMGLLAAVNTLLFRYTTQTDIIIGSPVAGREHPDLENQIGFFVNTLALRNKFSGSDSFNSLLEQVRQTTLAAFEHQSYPFDLLVDELDLERHLDRNPLFDVMLVFQSEQSAIVNKAQEQRAIKITHSDRFESFSSKFDLLFYFEQKDNGLSCGIEFNSDLFYSPTIQRLSEHLVQLLKQIVIAPHLEISKLDFIPDQEKQKLLVHFNDTTKSYPSTRILTELFEEKAAQVPYKTALTCELTSLTYGELNERANQFAHFLQVKHHVSAGDFIALKLDRDEWLIISMIAVLKSGAVNLPIDEDDPEERIRLIVNDCKAKLIVDKTILSDFLNNRYLYKSINNSGARPTSEAPAYVIYTSGSQGKPKGVLIKHKGVLNQVCSKSDMFKLGSHTAMLHNSKMNFIAATWQLWAPLLTGLQVVLCNKDEMIDVRALLKTAGQYSVKLLELIPSQIYPYLDPGITQLRFEGIETLILTGEKINPYHLKNLQEAIPHLSVWNTYGQTESSNDTTCFNIPPAYNKKTVLIGRPIQNTSHYILDKDHRLLPIGIVGEIYTTGDGMAEGYINNKPMTLQKFIDNPYLNGNKMYRTGDLGRWLSDGSIECLGRSDDQIKIRGHRIELSEIEQALQQLEEISRAVVITTASSKKENNLVAFFTGSKHIKASQLRLALSGKIPAYALPDFYVNVDVFPLTPNGKLDKKRLPDFELNSLEEGVAFIAPKSRVEHEMAKIWSEVLGIAKSKISYNSVFFDLGGHSLKALALMNRIRQKFNIAITLKTIFKTPGFKELCAICEEGSLKISESNPDFILPLYLKEGPISYQQERRWIQYINNKKSYQSNVVSNYLIEGNLSIPLVQRSFNHVISRHHILSTVFREKKGKPVQIVTNKRLKVKFKNIQSLPESGQAEQIRLELLALSETPFDISNELLLKCSVIKTGTSKFILILCIHHIIYDDWSFDLILQEFAKAFNLYKNYKTADMPLPELQFLDYTNWQINCFTKEEVDLRGQFFTRHLGPFKEMMKLPGEKFIPMGLQLPSTFHFDTVEKNTTKLLQAYAAERKTTLQILSMSIFNTLIRKYLETDVVLLIPVANRIPQVTENMIGGFNNLTMLRLKIHEYTSPEAQLADIHASFSESLSHQDFPVVFLERHGDQYPKGDMSFKYVHARTRSINLEGLEITTAQRDVTLIKPNPWLHFVVEENADGSLLIYFYFRKGQFNGKIMKQMLKDFKNEANHLVKPGVSALAVGVD